ncbi:MAG: hypothetical protein J6M60_07090 [Clostridia bacterium]|nr:hypothetical protein [Clostridia bacterium]
MIVLSRKRILVVSGLLFASMIAFVMQNKSMEKTVPTVSLPVSNKVIVLDAGHGKPDEGAQSSTRYNRGRN